jgi:large subunit ribosomal protein L32e
MPNIGYKSPGATRFCDRSTGLKQFNVTNPADLEVLLMRNKEYTAVLNKKLGARKRELLVKRAKELNVKVFNEHSKLKKQDKE